MAADRADRVREAGTSIVHQLLGDEAEIVDVQLIGERDLELIIGPDMLEQLLVMLGQQHPEVYTPRRGTHDYREMLAHGAQTTDMEALTHGISHIWQAYRWPGVLDYMELLIARICDYSTPLTQDENGVPQIHMIIKTGQDEADLLETAVAVSNEPGAEEHGYDFSTALKLGKRLVSYVESWRPTLQEALRAQSADHPELVRPILVHLPGLRDDHERVLQGVLVTALAAVAVSNPHATRQQLLDNGIPVGDFLPVRKGAKRNKRRK